ncbi:hypothetical protein [Magnetospirillum sulfuroxidans]|uniref:CdiI immunity protein domain-containing protein n=1 Tax=Magnetospirillum sulfuroxidans TaxID=611300 RepID=A0ABS5IHB4_9PROT|nr:hypothetical protein [Magnetospirillum sulfuroxidans]MBR9973787.1 hypothetical protein [Magnetospirillum sulfuroxidans]
MEQNIEAEIFGLAVTTSNALGWRTRLAGYIGTNLGHLDADCGIVATCEQEYVTAITQFAELLPNALREALDMEELSEADRDGLASFAARLDGGYDPDALASAAREDWGRILASAMDGLPETAQTPRRSRKP